jgi:eukaryotic-like serine/threonine-protein kinase
LPADFTRDTDRVRRFQQEARAASALNHPNIITIYEIGQVDDRHFIATEFIDGQTLRQHISGSHSPITGDGSRTSGKHLKLSEILSVAIQTADALSAAHEAGIVHRDIKPENIMVRRRDSYVKVLDFGLAKLTEGPEVAADSEAPTRTQVKTSAGVILGTTSYMSPEQARGEKVDVRTDIWSLGVVLYEMVTGCAPFERSTPSEVIAMILEREPLPLARYAREVPTELERIVSKALTKDREERHQTAKDLLIDLRRLRQRSELEAEILRFATPTSGAGVAVTTDGTQKAEAATLAPVRSRQRLWLTLAGMLLLATAVALVAFLAGKKAAFIGDDSSGKTPPLFHRLTFRRGNLGSARFAPDGQTIIYGAIWEGDQLQLFSTRPESPESRPVGLSDANILAISSSGEMAILLYPSLLNRGNGTLARMALAGGAPREVLRDVKAADWAPDGNQLAVIHMIEGRDRLEFPIGKVLYEPEGRIGNNLRLSPKGDLVAFSEDGSVEIVDLTSKKKILSSGWADVWGIAWSPSGDEIWFTASELGLGKYALYAVTISGQQRLVERVPGSLILQDISHEGRVLLKTKDTSKGMMVLPPGEAKERDLSWLDWGHVRDLSVDGKTLIFEEQGEGSGGRSGVYLRKTDGAPAIRLGDGDALSLSPNGESVLSIYGTATIRQLVLLPTGAGESKPLTDDKITCLWASWFPDGKRVLLLGKEPEHDVRCYILDIESGNRRPITPEGIAGVLVSPDGKFIITYSPQQGPSLFPLEGGEPRPIPGFPGEDDAIQWSTDARSIYVRHDVRERPTKVQIYRLDLATGRRELWKEFMPDPAGIFEVLPLVLTRDGKSYAYTYGRQFSDLYLVEGLK